MRKLITIFCIYLAVSVQGQTIHTLDSAWIRDNYTKLEKMVPMRDGKSLFTAIYLPKDASEKHPILMNRTPYSCAPYGEKNFRAFWEGHWKYYMREGYIIVLQDVRGRWMSEGEFVDVRPFNKNKQSAADIDEASDTYDAIDWLIKNVPANNGNVGVFGISYPGFYSTMAAASGHPALKAVSPQAPVTDWFLGDDFHHNGAFCLMDAFLFYAGGFGYPRPVPTTQGPVSSLSMPRNDNYESFLRIGALSNFMKLTGDSIKFWKDLYAHPNYDTFWKARNARTALFDVKPVMLTVGGVFDAEDTYGAWNTYKAIEAQSPSTNNRIVMGPWYHGQWSRGDGSFLGNVRFGSRTSEWYQNNIEIPFFNYYLKGKGEEPKIAEATVFFTGENKWKQLPQWPPAGIQPTPLYLQPNGGLAWQKPSEGNSMSEYVSDPSSPVPYTEDIHYSRTREYMTDDQRFAGRRPDVLTFNTEILENDLTLAGPLVADLLVSISSTDADFVVKLIDVFPDNFKYDDAIAQPVRTNGGSYPMGGYQMLVRGEIMRGKFRKSFESPVPFKPNKTEQVKFTLPDIAHTFKKGHRLMIQVQSSWFPLMDRNPQQFMNIYEARDEDFRKATIRVLHNSSNASSVILPIVK
ncbi:CocE/NonD family hydrolase [Flavihumibacter solisilvae]|uniref:X-Pro dipeptidyl-peptidase n=1 Tax=Flavihumibacter solisilvae TaxID=1349421 RepID=A0A0C1IGK3_9BACT|nr:CocE/NonD family hydrolase [Flavihumibacter solisilvae]KIC93340.1 X-Pro dipeptidyl-peptidase [Flavihumibacter solisilvae]